MEEGGSHMFIATLCYLPFACGGRSAGQAFLQIVIELGTSFKRELELLFVRQFNFY